MNQRPASRRAVVVGGGIAGLCAAFELERAGWQVDVHEASGRWGGKVHSSPVGERVVDAGPDTFLARAPAGRELCADLGLEDELESPCAPVPAYLARGGSLHELPAGSMLGVPTDLEALARSGMVSATGVEHARFDLDAPPTRFEADISVGELCRSRLGTEITDWLIDPILGGINASDIDRLSLVAGAPLLAEAVSRNPSLIKGMQELRPAAGATLGDGRPSAPVFLGLPGGIARIVDRLLQRMHGRVGLHLNSPIASLEPLRREADAVIVATPAFAASVLVAPLSRRAKIELAAIEYASVAQVVVEIPRHGIEQELDAAGILFPRAGGTLLTACTWLSSKWAHYRRPDTVLLRLSSGRFGDRRPASLSGSELVEVLLAELSRVIPINAPPSAVRVTRWDRSFPQYTPGHASRVARACEALASDAPTVRLAGAAYHGIGLPACIDSGRLAAQQLLDQLG
jgi:oxygen-dependent protoporphyrinogen oxidase